MSGNADLTAIIDGDTKGLISALSAASEQMKSFEQGTGQSLKKLDEQFANTFGSIKDALGAVKTTLATAAPVLLFNYLHSETDKALEQFRKIGEEADKLALDTGFFQTLKYLAGSSGVDFSKVTAGIGDFIQNLAKLKDGEEEFKTKLGPSNAALADQLKGAKDVESAIRLVSDAMNQLKSPIDQETLAAKAFGKGHEDMARVLNDGSAALSRAAAEAERFGLMVDDGVIRHSQQVRTAFGSVSDVIDIQFKQALVNVGPWVQNVSGFVLELTKDLRDLHDAFTVIEHRSDAGIKSQIDTWKQQLADLRAEMRDNPQGTWIDRQAEALGYGAAIDQMRAKELGLVNKIVDAENILIKREQERKELNDKLTARAFKPDDNGGDKDAAAKLLEGQRAMDQLMQRYYTDTHQYYQAIEADAQKERDRFKLLLEEKKIDANQYSIAMVLIAKRESTQIEEAYDHLREHIRTAMQGFSSEFEKILGEWQSGQKITLQSIEKDFVNMIERMVLKAAVLEPLFGTGKTGPEPGVFDGAVRYHQGGIAGLMPGEVPAILQQGETVIPKGGAMPGAGRGHTFNISIQTPNPAAFRESQGQIAAMLSQAVARGSRNL